MNETCPRCGACIPLERLQTCPRCFFEAELPPLLVAGVIEIGEEIGRGGAGVVYRGRHRRLGRDVAVKFLGPALAARADARARFEREARALASLSHPNVLTIYDVGEEDGELYIVTELAAGGSLAAILPVEPVRAIEIAASVCDALAHAHRHGFVHRDIKPENVLLGADGEVKVGDFGITGLLATQPGSTLTAQNEVVGTLDYMAPEARRGARPDPRQDVYAVGAVLYEMITGALPLGSFEPLPGAVDGVVRRALAPDPTSRYANAAELGSALSDLRERGDSRELPADERTWGYAVSLLLTIATAVVLWAILVSITPKVIDSADVAPLIMLGVERLADGRVVSRARFETGPTLLAMAAVVLALAGYALLRLHWRRLGLDRMRNDGLRSEGRWVLYAGIFALAAYGLRQWLEAAGYHLVARYIPIVGGLLEIIVVFLFWSAVLESLRTGRALRRQTAAFIGVLLALVPPIIELTSYLSRWQP